MSADPQPQKSSRSWLFLVARWAAALLILGILFYLLPVEPLRNALSRVPLSRFVAVLLVYLVALTGGITKWHTVVNSAGAQLNFAASAECYTSGLFGALFLPSIIGGDVARLAVGISRSPHRSEEHTSELQSLAYLVCRLLLEKKKIISHHDLDKNKKTKCRNS